MVSQIQLRLVITSGHVEAVLIFHVSIYCERSVIIVIPTQNKHSFQIRSIGQTDSLAYKPTHSSTRKLISSQTHQLTNLSTRNSINSQTHQLTTLSTRKLTNSQSHQLKILDL